MPRLPRRWFSPLILLFACLQSLTPGLGAVADAWRVDQRAPYAHIESETRSSCVLVHGHDCVLCAVATGANGTPAGTAAPISARCAGATLPQAAAVRPQSTAGRAASQRAPPMGRG